MTENKRGESYEGEALRFKVANNIVHSVGMYKEIMKLLSWRMGGGQETLVEDENILRKPEEMVECVRRSYENKFGLALKPLW